MYMVGQAGIHDDHKVSRAKFEAMGVRCSGRLPVGGNQLPCNFLCATRAVVVDDNHLQGHATALLHRTSAGLRCRTVYGGIPWTLTHALLKILAQ
jgi:hypothetical protein